MLNDKAISPDERQNNALRLNQKSKYRPEIDGLRAIAVIAVIIHHFYRDILPSGYLGVDVFFVISGYVITSSLAGRTHESFKEFILGFWIRRIKRLFPALVVCVLLTGVIGFMFIPPAITLHETTWKTGVTALFGVSNLYLFRNATDYFGVSSEFNLFTQTWSLGVEEQFYVFFPLMVWLSGFASKQHYGTRNLAAIIVPLSLLSFAGFWYLNAQMQPAAYFLMPPRFWELGVGCLLFLYEKNHFRESRFQNYSLLAITLLIVTLFSPREYQVFPTFLVVFLTSLLISNARSGTSTHRLLTIKSVVFIGTISYSLYLWHWSILVISRWTIGIHWWSFLAQIALIFLLAYVSYRFIEKPIRFSSHIRGYKTIGYGIATSFAAAGLLAIFGSPMKDALYTGQDDSLSVIVKNKPVRSCNLFENPRAIELDPKTCGLSVGKDAHTIYVLGDSHGFQFNAPISHYAKAHGYNFVNVWGNSCTFPAAAVRNNNNECNALQTEVLKRLSAIVRKGDKVIVGNALYARFSGAWGDTENYQNDFHDITPSQALALYIDKLGQVARTLRSAGVDVIVYLDSTQFHELASINKDPAFCNEEWFRPIVPEACTINKAHFLQAREPIENGLHSLSSKGLIYIWDGLDKKICPDERCEARFMADSNHFTTPYAWYIANKFLASIDQLNILEKSPSVKEDD